MILAPIVFGRKLARIYTVGFFFNNVLIQEELELSV